MKRCILLIMVLFSSFGAYAKQRAMSVKDLWSMRRIEEIALSPDGEWIVFTLTQYDVEKNKEYTDIFLVNSMGGDVRQLTTYKGYDGKPCWSPDQRLIAFISERDGTRQIYALPTDGGEAQKISDIPGGLQDLIWSPDGKYFAFTARTHPADKKISSQSRGSNTGSVIFDNLSCYRDDGKQMGKIHIFVMPATGKSYWDVIPQNIDLGWIRPERFKNFTFSPDGREIAFVCDTDSLSPFSTNSDIFVVPSRGGRVRRITKSPANDERPVYSPDGNYIAYRSMRYSGFPLDQYDLMIYNRKTGKLKNLTDEFDLNIREIAWDPSSKKIFFTSDDQGRVAIFSVELKNKKIKSILLTGCNTNLYVSKEDDKLYFLRTKIDIPREIFQCNKKGEKLFQITFSNQKLLNELKLSEMTEFWFTNSEKRLIHGFILRPPFFNPSKIYPAVLLTHNIVDDAWRDEFVYHSSPQMFASHGYVVIMINNRGSRGYGRDFHFLASRNWGGAPYRDIMSGLNYVLDKYPFIDSKKIVCVGSYMTNWIAGHSTLFKCLISDNAISELFSFYGTTEQRWFAEWELGGNVYENYKLSRRWSPVRYAKDFSTPTLIIHGTKNTRVPINQGLQMFTALQRKRVPSRLLIFPDEGRIISNPKNAETWWNTVFGWIDEWIEK